MLFLASFFLIFCDFSDSRDSYPSYSMLFDFLKCTIPHYKNDFWHKQTIIFNDFESTTASRNHIFCFCKILALSSNIALKKFTVLLKYAYFVTFAHSAVVFRDSSSAVTLYFVLPSDTGQDVI